MADGWFYRVGLENRGPVSDDEMRAMIERREIRADDYVWREGTPDWVQVRTVFEPPRAGGPPPRSDYREERRRDDYGPVEREPAAESPLRGAPVPGKLKAAGIIWIIFGGLVLLQFLVVIITLAASGAPGSVIMGAGMCAGGLIALIAAALIFIGAQSVVGAAPGSMANGVGSCIFSAIAFAGGLAAGLGQGKFIEMGFAMLASAGWMVAGILAIQVSGEYLEWRRVNRPTSRRPRYDDRDYDRDRRERNDRDRY